MALNSGSSFFFLQHPWIIGMCHHRWFIWPVFKMKLFVPKTFLTPQWFLLTHNMVCMLLKDWLNLDSMLVRSSTSYFPACLVISKNFANHTQLCLPYYHHTALWRKISGFAFIILTFIKSKIWRNMDINAMLLICPNFCTLSPPHPLILKDWWYRR